MTWVWVTVLAAFLFAGSMILISQRLQRFADHFASDLVLLRQARIDLAKGYLHVVLAGKPSSPFDRNHGFALLAQAGSSLEQALRMEKEFVVGGGFFAEDHDAGEWIADFARSVARFRGVLSRSVDPVGGTPALEVEARIAFYTLEHQADVLDSRIRQDHSRLIRRNRQLYSWTLWGGLGLLLVVCGAAYVGSRARQRGEEALRESERRYRGLFENMQEGFAYCRMVFENSDPVDFEFLSVNAMFETLSGLKEVVGRKVSEILPGIRESDPAMFQAYARVVLTGKPERFEIFVEALQQWFSISVYSPEPGYFVAVFDVITDRKRAEAEKGRLQAQLQQAMKMEAVGKLAGGIAHDFNNLLTVITGYCELLLSQLGGESPLGKEVEEIQRAGERAASLTRQLLAFSRRQVLQPKVLDLNEVVSHMEKMLRRLIGEDVELRTVLGKGLWSVKADPGQVEQVIVNLVLNARDAMPGGGKLTIETDNVSPDEDESRRHPMLPPGGHVLLAISDTGVGMDEKTISQVFEPFFTTKELGKGTGLGLSTVYGIVQQSGGHISVYSEPGEGSTFKVCFPRTEDREEVPHKTLSPAEDLRGEATVLVVEDEESILKLAGEVLGGYGYSVLPAGDGEEALRVAGEHGGAIHLVLTDVVMPRMGGRELYERIRQQRPGIKVLYMSGYTDHAIVHHVVLEEGTAFLQKPYSPISLARKVKEVLETQG